MLPANFMYRREKERRARLQRQDSAPTFTKKPTIKQLDGGKRLQFHCEVDASPAPTFSWSHETKGEVKHGGRYKTSVVKDGKNHKGVLEISDVTPEDAGKYMVTAKNDLGESNVSINLSVDTKKVPPPKGLPTFTEKPVIKQSDDASTVTFECKCVGDPAPTVTWYHSGELVKEGGRVKMIATQDGGIHLIKLVIGNVDSKKDGGEYKVVAKNKVGEGAAIINLNFAPPDKK